MGQQRLPPEKRNTLHAPGSVAQANVDQTAAVDANTALSNKIHSIYGTEADNLSSGVSRYMGNLREDLYRSPASADIYNQEAGRERGIAETRAGLSGMDTSASSEQARRNSIYGAAVVKEAAQKTANADYGKAVGNMIGGVNKIEQQAEAKRLASLPVPVAKENSGGLLDSITGWVSGWLG